MKNLFKCWHTFQSVALCLLLGCGATPGNGGSANDAAAADIDAVAVDDAAKSDTKAAAGGDTTAADQSSGGDLSADTAPDAVGADLPPKVDAPPATDSATAADTPPVADAAPAADVADAAAKDAPAPNDAGAASDVAVAVVAGPLVEAGWSFGECMGQCKGVVAFKGASLLLTVSNADGSVDHQAKGVLTTGAAADMETLENALIGQSLQTTYGCPDCADGGASWLTFSNGGSSDKHLYEFGKPPAALQAMDKLVTSAIAALKACKGDDIVVIQGVCPITPP